MGAATRQTMGYKCCNKLIPVLDVDTGVFGGGCIQFPTISTAQEIIMGLSYGIIILSYHMIPIKFYVCTI